MAKFSERLLDTRPLFRRNFEEGESHPFREFPSLIRGHLPLGLQVDLVPHNDDGHVLRRFVPHFVHPLLHLLVKRFSGCNIVEENGPVGSTVIHVGNCAVPLLSSSIPNLKFEQLITDLSETIIYVWCTWKKWMREWMILCMLFEVIFGNRLVNAKKWVSILCTRLWRKSLQQPWADIRNKSPSRTSGQYMFCRRSTRPKERPWQPWRCLKCSCFCFPFLAFFMCFFQKWITKNKRH